MAPELRPAPGPTWGTFVRTLAAAGTLCALAIAGPLPAAATADPQRTFDTPEQAVRAFVDALRKHDRAALTQIFGAGSEGLLSSGDAVADRQARDRFLQDYDAANRLDGGGGKVVLVVGRDEFPFAIPLAPAGPVWRFDTPAGRDELLARRIGKNELDAIQVCLAVIDAEREYYSADRTADGVREYAQRFASSPGKRDGLYWATGPGDQPSPLGLLVARARAEGYRRGKDTLEPVPYRGYYYRILTAQGPNAPGGAYSYLAGRHMIGGFAVVAFPAQYGNSGVMTFIASHDGAVYQKNLGPQTAALARRLGGFDPDKSWTRVAP